MKFPDAESELIVRCCAAAGAGAAGVEIGEMVGGRGVEWDRFLALANRNSVTPMVAARLRDESASIPPQVARALALSYEVNALRSSHLARCAAEIADSLAAGGVPAIAIKGPALALAGYGDLALRVFGDLDFLIRREDVPRAAQALATIGYRSTTYRADVVESGFFPDVSLDFSREDSVVDLHWQLAPRYFPFAPDGEQIWSRTAEVHLMGRRVRMLGPADSIIFQAAHGCKHGWRTLAQICDFARVIASARPVVWTALLDEARRVRSGRMLLLGAELARSLELCEVPAELIEAARGDAQVQALSRRVTRGLFDLNRAVEYDEWRVGIGSIENARDRVRYIVERVAAPKMSDRALMPLPRALYPVYYVARPVLVAMKHGGRLFRKRRRT